MYMIRPWLAVGSLRETYESRLLTEQGIGAMLQLAEAVEQPGIVSLYLPAEDGEPLMGRTLRTGADFIREHQSAGRATLVACGLGISRSVTFAVAAIREIEGRGLLEAFEEVRRHHPQARPHPILWRSLCRYYGEDISYVRVLR